MEYRLCPSILSADFNRLGEQIKILENHSHMFPIGRDVHFCIRDIFSVVVNIAACRRFQQVDAPKQRAFSGAGSADDGGHVAFGYGKVNVPEHLVASKRLGKVVDL